MRPISILCGAACLATATQAAVPMVQPGQWVFRSRDDPRENRSVCVKDVRALVQIRDGGAICSRFVIESTANELTVHYTCPGNAHGRTTIKANTSRLLQIESQGISDRQPFALTLEGRRTGECASALGQPPH